MHTGGIATSLELYNDVTKVKEKEFKATFEIKTKALYDKLPFAFDMMGEILTESCLDDTRAYERNPCHVKIQTSDEVPVFRAYNGSTSCTCLMHLRQRNLKI